jgi:3'-5' exoribonuclease
VPSLAQVARLESNASGTGFFLCTRKERRTGRTGRPFLHLLLQDATGTVAARVLEDADRWDREFEAGEFVKVEARADRTHDRLELVVDAIRRVNPSQDRSQGFREELLVPVAPRPVEEMWSELEALIARIADLPLRQLVQHIVTERAADLRQWPAALTVHHAYRGGLLEHIVRMGQTGAFLAEAYGADAGMVIAGAILHDIGKLEELAYDGSTSYTVEGNLLGHIPLGARIVQDAAAALGTIPPDTLRRLVHIVLSHHGSRELGSPVEPMTIEAYLVSAVDDLDSTLNQVQRHLAEASGDGAFTPYHPRLGRVLLKPSVR